MSSLSELRNELRELRKESMKPVSRMRKSDIASEIERMRGKRETTPPVASVPGPSKKAYSSAVESVKKAKESEFPVKPSKQAAKEAKPKPVNEKKKISKSALRQMLEEMTSDEE